MYSGSEKDSSSNATNDISLEDFDVEAISFNSSLSFDKETSKEQRFQAGSDPIPIPGNEGVDPSTSRQQSTSQADHPQPSQLSVHDSPSPEQLPEGAVIHSNIDRRHFTTTQILASLAVVGIIAAIGTVLVTIVAQSSKEPPALFSARQVRIIEDEVPYHPDMRADLQTARPRFRSYREVCEDTPPDPGCLTWDWKTNRTQIGSIINYWCSTTTSLITYATVMCTSFNRWEVIRKPKIPCKCVVPWLNNTVIIPRTEPPPPKDCPLIVEGPCITKCNVTSAAGKSNCKAGQLCCRQSFLSTDYCCTEKVEQDDDYLNEDDDDEDEEQLKEKGGIKYLETNT